MAERSAGRRAPAPHVKERRERALWRAGIVLSSLKGLSPYKRKTEEDKLDKYSYSDESWAKYSDEAAGEVSPQKSPL